MESKDKRRRSRIDKIYTDEEYVDRITKNMYIKTPIHDHKILEILYEENRKQGKGVWKLNTSLLQDKNYIQRITKLFENVEKAQENEQNHAKKWDTLNMAIQTVSIQFSSEKAFQKRKVKQYILKELEKYNDIMSNQLTEQMIERIKNLENQLYKIHIEEIKGYKVRTRIPDFEIKEPKLDFYSKIEKKGIQRNHKIVQK